MSPPPSDAPPSTGLIAGKYELVKLIGRGGMGSVWEGRHSTLGTRVAIKFIEPEIAASGEARARFETEARAAASIQSKHAIQIYDHGILADGRPYMVMELLTGEPLDKQLDRAGKMTVGQAARIIQQVCRAVQRAHDAGITHRDLKPENIFLVRSPDDDDEVAKVLDFGIAKIKGNPGQGMDSATRTGTLLGTPYFMAPEQARGLRSVDHRADLWALGVIAFRCVVGKLPFDGESVGDLLVKICSEAIPVPSACAEGIPQTFDAWFAKACDRVPDNRFQSAHELADGLLIAAGLSVRRSPNSADPNYAGQPSHPSDSRASLPANTPRPVSPSGGATKPVPGVTIDPVVRRPEPAQRSARPVIVAGVGSLVLGLGVGTLAFLKFSARAATEPSAVHSTEHTAATSPSSGRAAPEPSAIHLPEELALPREEPAKEPSKPEPPTKKATAAPPVEAVAAKKAGALESPGKKKEPPPLAGDPGAKAKEPTLAPPARELPPVVEPPVKKKDPPPATPRPASNDPGY